MNISMCTLLMTSLQMAQIPLLMQHKRIHNTIAGKDSRFKFIQIKIVF